MHRTLFRTSWRLVAVAAALTVFAAACGDAGAETSGVATLADTDSDTDGAATDDSGTALSPEESALVFSECLRAEGLDVADIGVDADGNIDLGDAFQNSGLDPRSEEFASARDVCFPLLEGTAFGGGGGRAGLADNPELEDAFLAYSDCIRDEGFDVGDLTLGGPGAGAGTPPADGVPPERGAGLGQGGFGDPNTRFATQLGLDPEDPAVAAALEVCAPIIDNAFSGFGAGFGAGPGADG